MSSILKREYILICLSIFLLDGCGYKLIGSNPYYSDQRVTIYFEKNSLNSELAKEFQLTFNQNEVFLNKKVQNSDLVIQILDHSLIRHSAALGSGARTKEARFEYLLNLSFTYKNSKKEFRKIKNSKNYTFDESRILAVEEEEEQIRKDFITQAVERLGWLVFIKM